MSNGTEMDNGEQIKFHKECDERNIEKRQSSSKCPFGKLCSTVHFPCRRFVAPVIPFQKRRRKQCKVQEVSIYACNVRSINNKLSSVKTILENNDIDVCIINELNTKKKHKFKGYHSFNKFSPRQFHGISVLVKNHFRHAIRIPDESDLEIVHLMIKDTNPALHIMGVYLDCESRTRVDDIRRIWSKLVDKVESVLVRGEAVALLGDFNRAIDDPELTCGKKLLIEWLQKGNVSLLNDDTPTRFEPNNDNKTSILDLAIVSNNIIQCVQSFKVDSEKIVTPFSKGKNGIKQYTDHRPILVKLKMPIINRKYIRKKPIINYRNSKGWLVYKDISDRYADKMVDAINSIDNMEELERKIYIMDMDMQIESFGITWVKPSIRKKVRKKNNKELNEIFRQRHDDLEEVLNDDFFRKDLYQRIYKLKSVITGPKVVAQEPTAINDPITGELITDEDEIKRVSLEHNLRILRKNKPKKDYESLLLEKKRNHNEIMKKEVSDSWELKEPIFKKVIDKIKKKGKKVYILFTKAGNKYKNAIFQYMKKLIKTEQVPGCFKETSLTQIWKKKGSALDLNNMRFIHMREWRSKLLESIVTEVMKDDIVNATPKMQLGGMPGASSVEHLLTLKTWMASKKQFRSDGIFQVFDMEKFFDKESLLDCMYTLDKKANIDQKCYRIWYKLNEDARISVKTSVGESKQSWVKDSIGQGSGGAALVSSLNLGCAIDDTFQNQASTKIGNLGLNSLCFQDDISKLNDDLNEARRGCSLINETLVQKQLSINNDKCKYLIIGRPAYRKKVLSETSKTPLEMGGKTIEHSEKEKYLGDIIHEKGCVESITETIKERTRKLISKCDEIVQIADNPIMGGLGNSTTPFKLFEATIIPALLHNCESWISFNASHAKLLQKFQDDFVRKVMRLADSTPKAIINWDIGLQKMNWRVAYKKLVFVQKIMCKDENNIAKKVIQEEISTGIKGLAHECRQICLDLGLSDITNTFLTKSKLKSAIFFQMNEEALKDMTNSSKVSDRLTENPEDNTYIHCMSLPQSRIWFRYRARAIAGVKANFKASFKGDLRCRFCKSGSTETQEHLEVCGGTEYERRGLEMSEWRGVLIFWTRMTAKFAKLVKATKTNKIKKGANNQHNK